MMKVPTCSESRLAVHAHPGGVVAERAALADQLSFGEHRDGGTLRYVGDEFGDLLVTAPVVGEHRPELREPAAQRRLLLDDVDV